MRRIVLPLIAAAAGLLVLAPAQAAKLPPVSPDGLVLQPRTKFDAVYLKPGVDLSKYDRFVILPPYIQFVKDWMREQNEDVPFSVTPQWMDRTKQELSDLFVQQFNRVLSEKDGFQIVTYGAPDVLVLRPAIVDLDITAPNTMQAGVNSFAGSAGSATLYLEVYDSVTSTILARIYDAQSADNGVVWSGGMGNRAAAEEIIDRWAEMLRQGLQRVRVAAGESPDGAPPAAPAATPPK